MRPQPVNMLNKSLLCLILFILVLMSASVTHAQTYTFITKWGSEGSGDGQFNTPLDVAVDSSDNVYVAEWDNHRVQKFAEEKKPLL